MSDRIGGYRDLIAWQRGVDLTERVYLLCRTYPRDELFGLTSQTRRAALSVPANIAEGYGRGTQAAYVSFLRIARGSLLELETHLIVAGRIGVAPTDAVQQLLTETDEIGRMLHRLIGRIQTAPRHT